MPTEPRKIHIQLILTGNKIKQEFFHHAMRGLDVDWPFKKDSKNEIYCKICSGMIWSRPRFEIADLKTFARQLNDAKFIPGHLKLKIKQFRKQEVCMAVARDISTKLKDHHSGSHYTPGERLVI
jgi:hypothetical protein